MISKILHNLDKKISFFIFSICMIGCLQTVPAFSAENNEVESSKISRSCHHKCRPARGATGATGVTGVTGPTGVSGLTGLDGGVGLGVFGYFYNAVSQTGIDYLGVIDLPTMDPISSIGFLSSIDNGVIIPVTGIYSISYNVVADQTMTIALAQNDNPIPNSAYASFSNLSNPVGLFAQIIVSLNAGDVVTLLNLNQAGDAPDTLEVTTNTPLTVGFPVAMTLILLK